jgi:DNA-binding transcriptional ArsR family regulator/uncharacterized protein YndB with AHSA1/START domain
MAAYPDSRDPDDAVFRALADPSRRRLLDRLNASNGQRLRELCAGLEMARQSVSKHLAVLEAAGLVTTVRRGREKLHYLNAEPINAISERWIDRYDRPRIDALADLKRALEDTTVTTPQFVYTTYIHTTPEELWRALTEPQFTRRWWRTEFESDWEAGSQMRWVRGSVETDDPEQVVLESEPFRRLSYTWITMTPEMARSVGLSDELAVRIGAERRSTVAFDIEQLGETCKLTVLHGEFDPGSVMVEMIGMGWPRVLADLKTLLETGETLPPSAERSVPALVNERLGSAAA